MNVKENKQVKFGIIGTGKIARIHARNIQTFLLDVELVAVATNDEKRGDEFAREFSIPKVCLSYEEIFEYEMDAVLICSTAETHPPLIKKAAEKDVHVFCEKPIGFDLEKVDAAINAANKAGIKVFIGFNRRFDPHFLKAKQEVESGSLGELEHVSIVSRDPKAPSPENLKAPGALFTETMIHDLDMACFISGSKPCSIYVQAQALVNKKFKEQNQVDTAVATIAFENGVIAVIRNSWRATYGYDQRAEVCCSLGDVFVDNVYAHNTVKLDGSGARKPCPLPFFPERYQDSYHAEMRAFFEMISNNGTPVVTMEDGRRATVLALAAWESYTTAKVVEIN